MHHPTRRSRRSATALLLAILLAGAASARAGDPPSALDRPNRPGPAMFSVGPTLGWAPGVNPARWGVAGAVVLPPDAAGDFLGPLRAWNAGLILGAEWRRIDPARTLKSFDVGLRRYLRDPDAGSLGTALFVGLAGGVAVAAFPGAVAADDTTGAAAPARTARLGTFLVETGYEHRPRPGLLLTAKIRWRNAILRPEDFSNWSVHLDVGVPLPR